MLSALREALKGASLEQHSYLVGGSVRDLLMGRPVSDYDLCVEAPGGDLALASHLMAVGLVSKAQKFKKHGIITCKLGSCKLEISQTLKQHQRGEISNEGMFGNLLEDALSRDFTINSLYIRLSDMTLLDPSGRGLEDHHKRMINSIKDPELCLLDDPLRILRALRFVLEKDFIMHPDLYNAIRKLNRRLCEVPVERISEELFRMLRSSAVQTLQLLIDSGALQALSPRLYFSMMRVSEAGVTPYQMFPESAEAWDAIRFLAGMLWILCQSDRELPDSIIDSQGADTYVTAKLKELERCFVISSKTCTTLKELGNAYVYLVSSHPLQTKRLPCILYITDLLKERTGHLVCMLNWELRMSRSKAESILAKVNDLKAAESRLALAAFHLDGNALLPLVSPKDRHYLRILLLLLKLRWMQDPTTSEDSLIGLLPEMMSNNGLNLALHNLHSASSKIQLLWYMQSWMHMGLI